MQPLQQTYLLGLDELSAADKAVSSFYIQTILDHFTLSHSSCEDRYLNSIRIIGDCYLLFLKHTDTLVAFDPALHSLDGLDQIKKAPKIRQGIAESLLEMICILGAKKSLIDFPWFYPHFIQAVRVLYGDQLSYLFDQKILERIKNIWGAPDSVTVGEEGLS